MKKIHTINVNGQAFQVEDPTAARVDDTQLSRQTTWSGREIVDRLCPVFTKTGNVVTCRPMAGYPLTVQTASGATKVLRNGEEFAVGTPIPALAGENTLQADKGEIAVSGRADLAAILEAMMKKEANADV